MYSLENDLLKISVQHSGAELCEITSVKKGTAFMWHADPNIWGSFAPNLFPIIGGLKDGTYRYEGQTYSLPKHGFVRHNTDLKLISHTATVLAFSLTPNARLLEQYPFLFTFEIHFTLLKNTIKVSHYIKNTDTKPLYFSLGGHPAFKCPVFEGERYEDYSLVFETKERAVTHLLNPKTGLVSAQTKTVFEDTDTLALRHDLFDADALIFKALNSKTVTLKSKTKGPILALHYKDFNYLGIWAKPNGDFVCIEPWLGIADAEDTNQILEEKEAIIPLEPQDHFTASYTIEIHDRHL